MAENTHRGHRDRLRKRFLNEGLDHFEPHEVLEFLLYYSISQADTNPIAHNLLEHFGSFANVLEAPVEELRTVEGVGERSAVLIHMLPSLFRYYTEDKKSSKIVLGTYHDAGEFAASMFVGMTTEAFGIICVDSNRAVVYKNIVNRGTTNRTTVYPRDIAAEIINHNGQNVILAHNHPNGSLTPSAEDKQLTEDLIKTLQGLDILVIDHIIVSGERFSSMSEMGLLRDF